MAEISDRVKIFIFQYVDSVELLEVLLLLHADTEQAWNVKGIAEQLRSNVSSIERRLQSLAQSGLIVRADAEPPPNTASDSKSGSILGSLPGSAPDARPVSELAQYKILRGTPHERSIDEVAEVFRIQRHQVFALIYNSDKSARDFSNAFLFKKGKTKEDGNG